MYVHVHNVDVDQAFWHAFIVTNQVRAVCRNYLLPAELFVIALSLQYCSDQSSVICKKQLFEQFRTLSQAIKHPVPDSYLACKQQVSSYQTAKASLYARCESLKLGPWIGNYSEVDDFSWWYIAVKTAWLWHCVYYFSVSELLCIMDAIPKTFCAAVSSVYGCCLLWRENFLSYWL